MCRLKLSLINESNIITFIKKSIPEKTNNQHIDEKSLEIKCAEFQTTLIVIIPAGNRPSM